MNPEAERLKARTKRFALDVIRLVRGLPRDDVGREITRQLLRSGTGVAGNYRAACRARSKLEFAAKLGIALEESDESMLWLELITESQISTSRETFRLLSESDELTRIFSASRLTTLNSIQRSRTKRIGLNDD